MEKSKLRPPAVAGQFYPSSPKELKEQIASLIDKKAAKSDAIGCILPHAGYMYSGAVAARTISHIHIRKKVILLGPNHTGYGAKFSIVSEGSWQTPLGEVKIDSGLAKEILRHSQYLEEDPLAHAYEHSLEVELPFLQYFRNDLEIVPIILLSDEVETLKKIGSEIADTITGLKLKDLPLLAASSDMTHYEPQEEAQKKDSQAIEAILELDEDKLMHTLRRLNISMCGYAPVITMISAAKRLGARKAKLIQYQTSGDITQDKTSVVGYAGIILY
ncbi:MAG: AmmeMemoRadiSam system protein B [Candidatus Omnitrophica bacterium]|nr:AmmeMemoRadiSam system protein B [Candidatus Omnitrophota bacterium]MDD5591739.1 AmmeMemoRadiSam system protein B [Candidatus Omnitrophota bacterium]